MFTPRDIGEAMAKVNLAPLHLRVPYSYASLSLHAATIAGKLHPDKPKLVLHTLLHTAGKVAVGDMPKGIKGLLGEHVKDVVEGIEDAAQKEIYMALGWKRLIPVEYIAEIDAYHDMAVATAIRDFGRDDNPKNYGCISEPDHTMKALRIIPWHETANYWVDFYGNLIDILDQMNEESQKSTKGRNEEPDKGAAKGEGDDGGIS